MTDFQREVRIAAVMADDLKPYLLSDVLYGTLSDRGPAGQPYPLATVGGLLLRLRRLEAARDALGPDQYEQVLTARIKTDEMLGHWVVQAEQKAVREIKARLQTWGAFLDDAAGDPVRHRIEYPTQVENRACLALLLRLAGRAADGRGFLQYVDVLDARLKAITERGDFVWDAACVSGFSPVDDWWLYVRLRA